jgi:hypothetical protein
MPFRLQPCAQALDADSGNVVEVSAARARVKCWPRCAPGGAFSPCLRRHTVQRGAAAPTASFKKGRGGRERADAVAVTLLCERGDSMPWSRVRLRGDARRDASGDVAAADSGGQTCG